MTAYLALDQLFNFFLPALILALIMTTLSKLALRQSLRQTGWLSVFVRLVVVNAAVSITCALVTRHDGSMAQYALLVLGSALAVWTASWR